MQDMIPHLLRVRNKLQHHMLLNSTGKSAETRLLFITYYDTSKWLNKYIFHVQGGLKMRRQWFVLLMQLFKIKLNGFH